MTEDNFTPSRGLYNQVRAGFIMKGSSLSKWCSENGFKHQNALHCLVGSWNGPKAKSLRNKMVCESGINDSSINSPLSIGQQ